MSRPTVAANAWQLGEGEEIEALTFNLKQMYNRSTNAQYSTTPTLLAM